MIFINSIFRWINIISFIFLREGILVITERYTPIHTKKKLEGKELLKSWRNTRFLVCLIKSIGFYSFTLSKNLSVDVSIKLVINLVGLTLIFIGVIINIRNNVTKIGKWSSSI